MDNSQSKRLMTPKPGLIITKDQPEHKKEEVSLCLLDPPGLVAPAPDALILPAAEATPVPQAVPLWPINEATKSPVGLTHGASVWSQISPSPYLWFPNQRESRFNVPLRYFDQLLDRLLGHATPTPLKTSTQASVSAPGPDAIFSATESMAKTTMKTVIVVAHPDDEAIGVGARLKALPDATLVHVTDGAPADLAYAQKKGFATREEYATARQKELLDAMKLVGVGPERMRCLNITDGEATARLVEISSALAEIFNELRPEVVLTHPYEGGHTDHDATAFAVHLACGILRRENSPAPLVLEFTSYNFQDGRRQISEFIPFSGISARESKLPPEAQVLKQKMYDCFLTQKACLSLFPTDREKFRPAPRYVFTEPPHEGPLLYEQCQGPDRGEQWRAEARKALENLRARRRDTQKKAIIIPTSS